ncbi:hypothetical protein EJB05_19119, partial [Eragrostis curvula]
MASAAAARVRCVLVIKVSLPGCTSARRVLRIRPSPAWTPEEDARLALFAKDHAFRRWRRVAEGMPGRSSKQCRDRWRHHLARDVYHRPFTAGDDEELARLFRRHGGRWKEMSRAAHGRTSRIMRRRWKEIRGTDAILSKLWRPPPPTTTNLADIHLGASALPNLAPGLPCMPVF